MAFSSAVIVSATERLALRSPMDQQERVIPICTCWPLMPGAVTVIVRVQRTVARRGLLLCGCRRVGGRFGSVWTKGCCAAINCGVGHMDPFDPEAAI
jgi:hypothetical protein